MKTNAELIARVAELEADVKRRDEQIKDLRRERFEALELVDAMREYVKGAGETIDQWIYAFGMEQNEAGNWSFDERKLWEEHQDLWERHQKHVREWNRFVREYNAVVRPRDRGRPLAASEAQVKDVLKLNKEGGSLRGIVAATGLTLRTVRTIVEKHMGTGRTSKRTNELRKREFDRLRAADYRARKKARDQLPKAITETKRRGDELLKAAKGIGS